MPIPPRSCKLLLFDIDGTLLLSGGAGMRALTRTFEELFDVADGFRGIPVAGRTDPGILDEAITRAGLSVGPAMRSRFHERYCALLEQEIVHPGPRKGVMPGVRGLLDVLAKRPDVSCGLVTGNVARAAQIKLDHFGLARFFAHGAYGDDAPERDHLVPIAVARARERGVTVDTPRHVLVVGDTPLDVRCATAAGAAALAVATGNFDVTTLRAHQPLAVLPDLTDTEAFLTLL